MTWEAWYTLGTIALVTTALATDRIGVDTAMVGGLVLLLLGDAALPGDILPLADGIRGFAHPAVIMIGAMFVVASGLQATGGMEIVATHVLGRPKSVAGAQFRLMAPVAIMSGFMNNTPIVAMYLPIVGEWARKLRISPSKLFMPLSFAAILGGKLTLIGTASNMVVVGLYVTYFRERMAAEVAGGAPPWLSKLGLEELSSIEQFWSIGALGVPTAIVGILAIMLLSRWLLPERRSARTDVLDARRYQVEMLVQDDSPIIGRSIEDAGLRHLPGLYLAKIERDSIVIPAVAPAERILAGDRLAFTGIVESVVDLRRIRGLVPATDQVKKVTSSGARRTLVEAVVARNSPLVGRTVRRTGFRTKYNAAIIAVHRRGEHIHAKVGDITLQAGDTLLLDTHDGFVSAYRNSDDFHLVSRVEGSRPIRHERAWVALLILVVLLGLMTLSPLHPALVALVCAGLMVGTRCLTGSEARLAVNWQVLMVIGAALGIGQSMIHTGAATGIAHALYELCGGFSPHGLLLVSFIITTAVAQVVTNYGAAVLMFPIVTATAQDLGVSPLPFVMTLMIAAGTTLLSPVAYQTNLMVYGAGGYRFFDFARLGLPLTLIIAATCIIVAPIIFPFIP